MGEFFDQIPDNIQDHIKDISKSSGLPDNEESTELIAKAWIDKKIIFEEKIDEMNMEELVSFEKEDTRGVIALTYSGSLINVGPMVENTRNVEYTSIGIRSDVPDSAVKNNSILLSDINIDEAAEFEVGPVKSTSPIFKIAVCKGEISVEEQEETLKKTTVVLSDEFAKINNTLISS